MDRRLINFSQLELSVRLALFVRVIPSVHMMHVVRAQGELRRGRDLSRGSGSGSCVCGVVELGGDVSYEGDDDDCGDCEDRDGGLESGERRWIHWRHVWCPLRRRRRDLRW